MESLFVGVDVSKDYFCASGLDVQGNVLFSLTATADKSGFTAMMNALSSHSVNLAEVMVAMESSGCYHLNLFSFLTSENIKVVVVNPLLIANYGKLSLRKTKTDKKDALVIARYLYHTGTRLYGLLFHRVIGISETWPGRGNLRGR